jgi:VanZ family protein
MVGPIPSVEEAVPMSDKVELAAAFAVITAAVLVNFPRLTRMQVIPIGLLLGVAIEVVQGLTGRDASASDIAVDVVGMLVVLLAWTKRRLI